MLRTPRRIAPALVFLIAALLTIPAAAEYVMLETENVPVDRVVTNLEALIAASPNDARLKFNLARTHAMAFTTKRPDVKIAKGLEGYGVWFGHEAPNVPFGRVQQGTPEQQPEARAHLEKAIALYAEVIAAHVPARPPGANLDLMARLGYAWCLEQSGDRAKAIAAYREALTHAWEKESVRGGLSLGPPITPEAFSYLRPLLDPEKDKAELALWSDRASQIERKPRPITPIAIPLRDGMMVDDVIAPNARVQFDADGSGLQRTWSWISSDAGWLVYDQRGTRNITSALQWFGSVTFWLFWQNGYEPMRALDDNHDGKLEGRELEHLAIWRDVNQDGVTGRGEFAPLSAWKIRSLSCDYEVPDDARMAAWSKGGVTFQDGRVRPTWDVMLQATR